MSNVNDGILLQLALRSDLTESAAAGPNIPGKLHLDFSEARSQSGRGWGWSISLEMKCWSERSQIYFINDKRLSRTRRARRVALLY